MSLSIDIRDKRLEKGRLGISAGTTDPAERDARKASILQLLGHERGRAIIQRLRKRELSLEEVHEAVQRFDLDALEEAAKPETVIIGLAASIDAWLRNLEGMDRAPGTVDTYRVFATSIEKHFGVERDHGEIVRDVDIGSITRLEGEEWLTGAKGSNGDGPWKPGTQRVAHSLAAQIWDRAIAEDEERSERAGSPRTITRNFWRRNGSTPGVRGGRVRKTRHEFLTRDQAASVLWANRGTEKAAWIAVGIYAGLRGGEAANLRQGIDLDLAKGVLRVQSREGEHAWRVKTENSERTLPIHPRLARWLQAHIAQGYAGQMYVFTMAKTDRPLSRSGWRWWTKQALEAGGVRYGRQKHALTYHSMRHTFASWLTLADVHPKKIAALMGDTVEMVMSTYAHLVDEDLETALLRL